MCVCAGGEDWRIGLDWRNEGFAEVGRREWEWKVRHVMVVGTIRYVSRQEDGRQVQRRVEEEIRKEGATGGSMSRY